VPKILFPKEIKNKAYPQNPLEIHRTSRKVEEIIYQTFAVGEVISASSYGSAYFNHSKGRKFSIVSDIDWLIVFRDVKTMLESDYLRQVFQQFNESHIPFNSPILSIENIKCGNHLIAPLLAGVRIAANRVIVGEDPLRLFSHYGIRADDNRVISSIFSSFLRYFFELSLGNYESQSSPEKLVGQLQRAIDYFQETYRTMVVVSNPMPQKIDYQAYETLLAEKIDKETLTMGLSIDQFIRKYKRMITAVIHDRNGIESEGELKDLIAGYNDFLKNNYGVIKKAVLFCQENIKYYYNSKSGK